MYRDDLVYEFNDDMRALYHDGTIDDEDDFYNEMHYWIDNSVMYIYQSKQICDALDYDVFQHHDVFGKAENWSQAAYAALYDLLHDHDDALNFAKIKLQENE